MSLLYSFFLSYTDSGHKMKVIYTYVINVDSCFPQRFIDNFKNNMFVTIQCMQIAYVCIYGMYVCTRMYVCMHVRTYVCTHIRT